MHASSRAPAPPVAAAFSPAKRRVAAFIYTDAFHFSIISLVLFDLLLVFADLVLALNSTCTPEFEDRAAQDTTTTTTAAAFFYNNNTNLRAAAEPAPAAGPTCTPNLPPSHALAVTEEAIFWLSTALLLVFAADILLHLYVEGVRMFRSVVISFDALVVFSSLDQTYAAAIVALRIWKIVRIMHAVSASVEQSHLRTLRAITAANGAIVDACQRAWNVFAKGQDKFLRGVRRVERRLETAGSGGPDARRGAKRGHAHSCAMKEMTTTPVASAAATTQDHEQRSVKETTPAASAASTLDHVQSGTREMTTPAASAASTLDRAQSAQKHMTTPAASAAATTQDREQKAMKDMMDEAAVLFSAVGAALAQLRAQVAAANERRLERAIRNAHMSREDVHEDEDEDGDDDDAREIIANENDDEEEGRRPQRAGDRERGPVDQAYRMTHADLLLGGFYRRAWL
ncbi:hypothetical protein DFJ73DRAFT_786426 [Zopfochytrium polystomum]|nr:hypothetical protein DFJ73DRAFT_786426 [Zopfochytrium polystomum]